MRSTLYPFFFFFSSRRRHTRFDCDWSSDVCSSDLMATLEGDARAAAGARAGRLGFLLDRPEWLGPPTIGPADLSHRPVRGLPLFLALYHSVSDITLGSRTLGFV